MTKLNKVTVTVKGTYEYVAPKYAGYGMETRYIYTMQGEDGTVYVWRTTCLMGIDVECESENDCFYIGKDGKPYKFERMNRGDVIVINASIKGTDEYNGQPQIVLTRVKVIGRTFKAKTWEEIQAEKEAEKEAKRKAQLDSVKDGDMLWRMPYRQYKEHYSDCETVINSYEMKYGHSTILVIIREGRLKASGVRGEHYSGYKLQNENGDCVVYRAVKEENAIRRAEKEYGGQWKCVRVYSYCG